MCLKKSGIPPCATAAMEEGEGIQQGLRMSGISMDPFEVHAKSDGCENTCRKDNGVGEKVVERRRVRCHGRS